MSEHDEQLSRDLAEAGIDMTEPNKRLHAMIDAAKQKQRSPPDLAAAAERDCRYCKTLKGVIEQLTRDLDAEKDRLSQLAPPDTLAAAAEEAVLTLRSAAATIFNDDYAIFLRECEQAADRLAAAIEKRGR